MPHSSIQMLSYILDRVDDLSYIAPQDYSFSRNSTIPLLCGGRAQAFQTLFEMAYRGSTADSKIAFCWHAYIKNFEDIKFDTVSKCVLSEPSFDNEMIATHALNEVALSRGVFTVDPTLRVIYSGSINDLRMSSSESYELTLLPICNRSVDSVIEECGDAKYRLYYMTPNFFSNIRAQKFMNKLDNIIDLQIKSIVKG